MGGTAAPSPEAVPPTPAVLVAMLRAAEKVSDLIFSPGRPPLVERDGRLIPVFVPGLPRLTADHTQHIAAALIGQNQHALTTLREQGACDVSYGLPGTPFQGQRFHAARQLRNRNAGNPHRHSQF